MRKTIRALCEKVLNKEIGGYISMPYQQIRTANNHLDKELITYGYYQDIGFLGIYVDGHKKLHGFSVFGNSPFGNYTEIRLNELNWKFVLKKIKETEKNMDESHIDMNKIKKYREKDRKVLANFEINGTGYWFKGEYRIIELKSKSEIRLEESNGNERYSEPHKKKNNKIYGILLKSHDNNFEEITFKDRYGEEHTYNVNGEIPENIIKKIKFKQMMK